MFSRFLSIWRALFRRSDLERGMTDEIRFHLEARSEDLVRSGLSQPEAMRRARIEFGGIEGYKERCREARGLQLWDGLRGDLRYAAKTLRKSPGFSITAILTLALGIGANTGLFTLIDTLLLRPIPVQDPWSLYQVIGSARKQLKLSSFSYREYQEMANQNQVFQQMVADAPVRTRTQGLRMGGYVVSGNYFSGLGVRTLLGRPILPEDTTPSSSPVVVLGHAAWQRIFMGDPRIVGKTIDLSGGVFTVVGVATPQFTGVDSLIPDFWAPLSAIGLFGGNRNSVLDDAGERWLRIVGRLRPGVLPAQAEASMSILLPRVTQSRPPDLTLTQARLDSRATYQSWNHADMANVIPILTGFALILLIACTNLSTILLARALNRQREIGVRLSLGASRGRIVRQLVTESTLLSLIAGGVGLMLANWSWMLIRHAIVSTFSMKTAMAIVQISPDYRVFAFTFLLSLVTGVIFGLAPALHATRPSLTSALRLEGALLGGVIRPSRFRDGLVVMQFSLSLVLLVGAGLLLHSNSKFSSVPPGFDVARAISIQTVQDTGGADVTLPTRLAGRLRTLPGVLTVAPVLREPLRGNLPQAPVSIGSDGSAPVNANYNEVSADYFDTLGIRILRGRGFTARETQAGAAVAVISEATAKRFWPGQDPLGKTIRIATGQYSNGGRERFLSTPRTIQVVGVVKDVISGWLWDGVDTTCVYLPANAGQLQYYSLLLRVSGNPKPFLPALRAALGSMDPIAEFDVRTMEEVMDMQLLPFRLTSWGAAALGGLGLLLASIGIYGVMAYMVSQRTREIGIRIALGAQRKDVLWVAVRDGCRLIAIAVGCGLTLSFAFSRILGAMIFKINVTDPLTFVFAPLILAVVGLLAAYLPGRKASRIDPSISLRYE